MSLLPSQINAYGMSVDIHQWPELNADHRTPSQRYRCPDILRVTITVLALSEKGSVPWCVNIFHGFESLKVIGRCTTVDSSTHS